MTQFSNNPKWNERYASEDFFYGTKPNDFLVEAATPLSRGRALCLAEGEGRNSVWLAKQGFDVYSVDLSDIGVAKTLHFAASQGVTVHAQVGDLADFVIEPQSFDLIVSIFAHTPSALRGSLHQRVVNGLRPGGIFILEAYRPDQIPLGTGGPNNPDMLLTADILRTELIGLEFDHLVEINRNVVEGAGHSGVAAVVQAIAHRIPGTSN